MSTNDYIFNEFISLNPTEFTFIIENVKFTCLIDSNFETIHQSPPLKQFDQLHFHTYYELFYIESGAMKIKFEEDEKILEANDLMVVSPKVFHRSYRHSVNAIRYNIKFFIDENPSVTDFSLYDALMSLLAETYFYMPQTALLNPIFKKISLSIRTNNKLELPLAFHELICSLLGSVKKNDFPHPNHIADSHTSRIYKIHHIISMHYMDDISLTYIAEQLFLSTRQVNRIIQNYYGCTFSELITRLRLNAAADFLITTNMKILEIASRVGYNSINGFYSAFKKQYGCLPLSYRKKNI